jgi:SAM-dependent methyltransferase
MVSTDFLDVTELSGDQVTREQVDRMHRRYQWVLTFAQGKDVLEVACGTGQGAGLLASVARSFLASDTSEAMLERARGHYGDRVRFLHFDAQDIPLPDESLDLVVVCEALYYLPNVARFFRSVRRVLRPGGALLVVTANKDLFDFNPSPYSHLYLGVMELQQALSSLGFACEFFGDTPLAEASAVQRTLRPVKALVARSGLMPKTMAGKKLLKRLVFGGLVPMPFELTTAGSVLSPPTRLSGDQPDRLHKVIFCAARLHQPASSGAQAASA